MIHLQLDAVYQHTHDPKYLDTARSMATYFKANLPSDGIVPWLDKSLSNIPITNNSQGLQRTSNPTPSGRLIGSNYNSNRFTPSLQLRDVVKPA